MADFVDFIGDDNLVAHNASFDKRFLDAEIERLPAQYRGQFACSLLLSRRLFPDAPDHKLGTLVQYRSLPNDGGVSPCPGGCRGDGPPLACLVGRAGVSAWLALSTRTLHCC